MDTTNRKYFTWSSKCTRGHVWIRVYVSRNKAQIATDRCLFISASHAWVWRKIVLSRIGSFGSRRGRCNRGNDTRARAHDRPAFDNPPRVCAQRPRRAVKTIYIFRLRAWLGIKRANYEKARRGSPKRSECECVEDTLARNCAICTIRRTNRRFAANRS